MRRVQATNRRWRTGWCSRRRRRPRRCAASKRRRNQLVVDTPAVVERAVAEGGSEGPARRAHPSWRTVFRPDQRRVHNRALRVMAPHRRPTRGSRRRTRARRPAAAVRRQHRQQDGTTRLRRSTDLELLELPTSTMPTPAAIVGDQEVRPAADHEHRAAAGRSRVHAPTRRRPGRAPAPRSDRRRSTSGRQCGTAAPPARDRGPSSAATDTSPAVTRRATVGDGGEVAGAEGQRYLSPGAEVGTRHRARQGTRPRSRDAPRTARSTRRPDTPGWGVSAAYVGEHHDVGVDEGVGEVLPGGGCSGAAGTPRRPVPPFLPPRRPWTAPGRRARSRRRA